MTNIITALIIVAVFFTGGCTKESAITEKFHPVIINLSAREAREIISNNESNFQFEIIDVRTSAEFREGHIRGAVIIDYLSPDFRKKITKLDRDGVYLLYCRSGRRSFAAAEVMRNEGFKNIYNLSGGAIDWEKSGYSLSE